MIQFIIYFLFFEFVPLFAYISYVIQLFTTYTNCTHVWGQLCIKFAGCKLHLINKSHSLYNNNNDKRCIFLPNHRDIYDFPIDAYLTGGSGMFLSRYINVIACPIQFVFSLIHKNVYYFKRDFIKNKVDFNKNIYNGLENSYCRNLIIYPEGTRRMENEVAQIKKGSTHIAWDYKMRIQIIITRNKEHIINLKTLQANYGVNLYCYRSEVIKPENFSSFEEFNSYVTLIWEYSWKQVYGPLEEELVVGPLIVNPYIINHSNVFYFFHNIFPLIISAWYILNLIL